ncbi:MAG: hypothetical protein ACLUTR_00850 [Ruminococcus bicirculans (ex Wegman et al. 2014)]|uniref:hypothetical protein n=1 Tax=Ruminococcus bicirculans (ex Wegman et al. 2014) TaxID=1160721 RepID=UPI003999C3DD
MKASAGEVYTVYNKYLERYTACQVAYIAPPDTVSKQSWAVILSLDWVGDAPLTAEELPHLRPLYKDFMYWPRALHLLRVPVEIPPQYTLVGILPSFTDEPCHSYGGWDDGYEVYLQMRWQAIPEERRRAFKVAMESDGETEIGGIPVKVSSHRVIDKYTPFDSALELEALPCLSQIICEQWHPDLLEFLRGNPFIHELTLLNHGQRALDLRGTSVGKLMLDMTGLRELWLDEETEQLLFQNEGLDDCTIHAPEGSSGLTIQFIGEYRPHLELPGLRGLHGIRLKDFDLSGLPAAHPHLKELRLWGAPGNLGHFSAVAQFRELTDLSTFDLFGFGAEDIPTPEQMPSLSWFWMTSLPEDAAKAAKRLWKGKPGMDLRITKPRKSEWLAQNLDNPFRGWDGAEHIPAASAKKAAGQYRKTRTQLMKLADQPGEDAQTQALEDVAAYTQTFNRMGFIETEERDEIYMALCGILEALPDGTLQKDALLEKFEQLRDF